jgi:hypothetical protein
MKRDVTKQDKKRISYRMRLKTATKENNMEANELFWAVYLLGAFLMLGSAAEQIDMTRKAMGDVGLYKKDAIIIIALNLTFWWGLAIVMKLRDIQIARARRYEEAEE